MITRVGWVHPSCRDLVIEELSNEPTRQVQFLKGMSLQGIKLSISDSGGAKGERRLPLMNLPQSWDLLEASCLALVSIGSTEEIAELLKVLNSAALEATDIDKKTSFIKIISSVCEHTRKKWDESKACLSADDLSAYCDASILMAPFSIIPKLETSWQVLEADVKNSLDRGESGGYVNPTTWERWTEFAVTIQKNEPRYLRKIDFPFSYVGDFTRLISVIKSDLENEPILDSADEYRYEADRLTSFANILETLAKLFPLKDEKRIFRTSPSDTHDQRENLKQAAEELKARAASLNEEASQREPPEPDDDDSSSSSEDHFDIDALFSDL